MSEQVRPIALAPDAIMGWSGERRKGTSSLSGPEWISTTIVDATLLTGGWQKPVQVRADNIRLPNGGGKRIASQFVGGGRQLIMAAQINRADHGRSLRHGILTL